MSLLPTAVLRKHAKLGHIVLATTHCNDLISAFAKRPPGADFGVKPWSCWVSRDQTAFLLLVPLMLLGLLILTKLF